MSKQYRILSFVIIGIVVLSSFVSCTTYTKARVTDEMAEQIAKIKFYVPKAEDERNIKKIYIYLRRYNTDSWSSRNHYDLIEDLNRYDDGIKGNEGVWYREHQDKIVSIKPVNANGFWHGGALRWFIEYID